MNKKTLFTVSSIILVLLFGVSFAFAKAKKQPTQPKLTVVTTIFPQYDWVREILGDKISQTSLTLLLDNGVDLHSYQPTVQDIAKISDCDVFIYVGGESDKWVPSALKNARNKNMQVVNLLEVLGEKVVEEEIVEGMQADDDHDHEEHHHDEEDEHDEEESHEHHHHHDDEEEVEYDEHVWLSLRNAEILVKEIASAISKADSANASVYQANANAYCAKLDALDKKYIAARKSAKRDTLLFGDRFPFRYMVEDYDIKYFAAFVGCSAETEASFETVAFLAKKLNELKLGAVCQIESGDGKIAKTIISTAKAKGVKTLTLDSLQSTTKQDIKKGASYLKSMEKNLSVLEAALN